MCLAFPGKIIEIEGSMAKVDYVSEVREVGVLSDEFSVGDYVIVQNKVIVEKIEKERAEKFLELINGS
jgi:hydrogenase expression/formation protein HypC